MVRGTRQELEVQMETTESSTKATPKRLVPAEGQTDTPRNRDTGDREMKAIHFAKYPELEEIILPRPSSLPPAHTISHSPGITFFPTSTTQCRFQAPQNRSVVTAARHAAFPTPLTCYLMTCGMADASCLLTSTLSSSQLITSKHNREAGG